MLIKCFSQDIKLYFNFVLNLCLIILSILSDSHDVILIRIADKCASRGRTCGVNAICKKTQYSGYVCKCKPGYVGNGYKCTGNK